MNNIKKSSKNLYLSKWLKIYKLRFSYLILSKFVASRKELQGGRKKEKEIF
jgi:hypothetical protein